MNTTGKSALRWVLVLVALAAGIGAVAHRRSTIASLRAENAALSVQAAEAEQLGRENQEIPAMRGQIPEVDRLTRENEDLPALRNQVRQLRRQVGDLAGLRAENQRLASRLKSVGNSSGGAVAPPPDFISKAAMTDAGLGTPEAAAQTFFWAASNGNMERAVQCIVGGEHVFNNTDKEIQRGQMIKELGGFTGFRIAGRTNLAPDEVQLILQSSLDGPELPMKFKLVDGGWKLAP